MADVANNETAKFQPEAHAGQSSSPTTGAGAMEGAFEPAYDEGVDPFLGEGAHVVSGTEHRVHVTDDAHDAPAMQFDPGERSKDDAVRSHGFDPGKPQEPKP